MKHRYFLLTIFLLKINLLLCKKLQLPKKLTREDRRQIYLNNIKIGGKMAIHEMNYIYERMILYREGLKKIAQNNSNSSKQSEKIFAIRRNRSLDRSVQIPYHDIPEINEDLHDFLFQSDIVLSPTQIDILLGKKVSIDANWIVPKKFRDTPEERKWPTNQPIPYFFDRTIGETPLKREIKRVLDFWSNHTCLSFIENNKNENTTRIQFIRGAGCYSRVGRETSWPVQDISIGYGCESFAIISHMIGHTLGLWHASSRPDRDDHISIVWDGIPMVGHEKERYEKMPNNKIFISGLPEEYDYDSLMHLPESKSIIQSQIEILANQPIFQRSMGQRRAPSFLDILTVNKINGCLDKCSFENDCQNGGFPNPKDCSNCICPWGFGGKKCDQRSSSEFESPSCGSNIHATSVFQTLYAHVGRENNYTLFRHIACHWHIHAPQGKIIEIRATNRSGMCSVGCFYGGAEIKLGSFTQGGVKFCCPSDVTANPVLFSHDNLSVISVSSNKGTQSFQLQYRYVNPSLKQYTTTIPPSECIDQSPDCRKNKRLCKNPMYAHIMSKNCRLTCGFCLPEREKKSDRCHDISDCHNWVGQGFCNSKVYSLEDKKFFCPKTCNLCKKNNLALRKHIHL